MTKNIAIHLISDDNTDLLDLISREVMSRFSMATKKEYFWPSIDTEDKLRDIIPKINETSHGFVIYNIKNDEIRHILKDACQTMRVPCIPALSRVIRELSSFLGEKPSHSTPEEYDVFTDDYFVRIDAMNYVLAHDDGQNTWDLDEADIIIIGVSRTSKSPTSIYLSHKGYNVANIPFVHNIPLPENLTKLTNKLIVGLVINPDRLMEIRKNRLIVAHNYQNQSYAARDEILSEIRESKRIFAKNHWPIIDVTNRSIEEIAAIIIKNYQLLIK